MRLSTRVTPWHCPTLRQHFQKFWLGPWAETELQHVQFFSFFFAPAPKKGATAAAKRLGGTKRPTNAHLAKQVQSLTSQMAALVESQKVLQQHILADLSADLQRLRPPRLLEVLFLDQSCLPSPARFHPPKDTSLGALTKALGLPPDNKSPASGLALLCHGVDLLPDEPMDVLQAPDPASQDPMIAALHSSQQQSRHWLHTGRGRSA